MSDDSQHDARRDEKLAGVIFLQNPVTYVNHAGVPTVLLPLQATFDKRKPVPINSVRVKAELTKLAWDEVQVLPHIQELNRLIHLLVGKAWDDVRSDEQLIDLFDNDPLLEALSNYMNDPEIKGEFSGTCSKLLRILEVKGEEELLDLKSKLWPASASQLSRRLNDLKPVLEQKLRCFIVRNRGPDSSRRIQIRRNPTDDDDELASNRRQSDNACSTNGLASIDDADAERAMQEKFAKVHLKNRRQENGSS